jgi:hypothetical protein
LHAEYVRNQINALSEQARELGQTAAKTGSEGTAAKGH